MDNHSAIYEEWQEQLHVYQGILFNNIEFSRDFYDELLYNFSCEEFKLLNEKYSLYQIAGDGSEFEKVARLTSHFAPKLTHRGDYDNHIDCNALSLLDYSYDQPKHGINCVAKSKILQECCLALRIYSRRIWLMPYSPYDEDCHVVNEIFDSSLRKWIMFDLTTNGYFVDENNMPLSVLEMRKKYAINSTCNFIKLSSDISEYFENREAEQLYNNKYFAKNLFYFVAEKENCFGDKESRLTFLPLHFNDKSRQKKNYEFRLKKVNAEQEKIVYLERSSSCDLKCLIQPPK